MSDLDQFDEGLWQYRENRERECRRASEQGDTAQTLSILRRTLTSHVNMFRWIVAVDSGQRTVDDAEEIVKSILESADESADCGEIETALDLPFVTLQMAAGIVEFCAFLGVTLQQSEEGDPWLQLAQSRLPGIIEESGRQGYELRPHFGDPFPNVLRFVKLMAQYLNLLSSLSFSYEDFIDLVLENDPGTLNDGISNALIALASISRLRAIPSRADDEFDALAKTLDEGAKRADPEWLRVFQMGRDMVALWKVGDYLGARKCLLESESLRLIREAGMLSGVGETLYLLRSAYLAERAGEHMLAGTDLDEAQKVSQRFAIPTLVFLSQAYCKVGLAACDAGRHATGSFFLKQSLTFFRTATVEGKGSKRMLLESESIGDELALSLIKQGRVSEALEVSRMVERLRAMGLPSEVRFIHSERAAAKLLSVGAAEPFAVTLPRVVEFIESDARLRSAALWQSGVAQELQVAPIGTALINYNSGAQGVSAIVQVGSRYEAVVLDVDEQLAHALLGDIRVALADRRIDPRKQLKGAYDLLIRPIEPLLRGISRLVIGAPGALHAMPWAALYDGERYVVEKWNYVRSVGPDTKLSAAPRSAISLLVCVATRQMDGLPALGADLIAETSPLADNCRSTVLPDDEFNHTTLAEALPKSTVLHIGGHFVADIERLERSYLLLGDGGKLQLDSLLKLGLSKLDLIVLASCQSAGTADFADERYGRATDALLIRGGAHAVLGTLWNADHFALGALMKSFYTAIAAGEDKDSALRFAQRDMISGTLGDGRWCLPHYWAVAALSGNWHGFGRQAR